VLFFGFQVHGSLVRYLFVISIRVPLIAWEDSSRNDLLSLEWDVKPY